MNDLVFGVAIGIALTLCAMLAMTRMFGAELDTFVTCMVMLEYVIVFASFKA